MSKRYQSLTGHLEIEGTKKAFDKDKVFICEKVIQTKIKQMKKIMFQIQRETATTKIRKKRDTPNPRRKNSYNYNLEVEATVAIQKSTITNIIHHAKHNT